MSTTLNVGELLNLVGLSTGVVLYAMLLAMVVRAGRTPGVRSGFDPLLLLTSILGLIWNLCALPAYELPKMGFQGPFPSLASLGFGALGFLPAVVVHSVLRDQRHIVRGPAKIALMVVAYAVSSVAAVLHVQAALTSGPVPSAVGMRLLTYTFVALVVPLIAVTRGRPGGTLLRRATDPWESHQTGIMNTLVPEPEIPSHQGPDAQTVDPDLDVVTMAVKVPETLAHLHYWSVQMTRQPSKDEVLDAFRTSSRIALISIGDGLVALNSVKELMADRGRPHDNLYEVALWADMLRVQGDELFYAYMVDNQAIVIPESIDAIRALTGAVPDGGESIARTNAALGIQRNLIGAGVAEPVHR